MVETQYKKRGPLNLVITGEANFWQPTLEQLVGPQLLTTYHVSTKRELMDVVESGIADAAVLDEESPLEVDVMHLLRMIHRLNSLFPVVIVTRRSDRRIMEDALRLAAFSVLAKPLELEVLLRQIQRLMVRLDEMLHDND